MILNEKGHYLLFAEVFHNTSIAVFFVVLVKQNNRTLSHIQAVTFIQRGGELSIYIRALAGAA